jgi:hypothetical protein
VQDTVPLPQAFALYTAICARYDLKPKGPDYVEREMIEALNKLEARLNPPRKKKKGRR